MASPEPRQASLSDLPERDRIAVFETAERSGRVGTARKTATVDARPARPGEIVVTVIAGEGIETVSRPAEAGDWVVRNRVCETGCEEILVGGDQFRARYAPASGAADAQGYQPSRPIGEAVRYTVVPSDAAPFAIRAPWGRLQRASAGDVLVRSNDDPKDIYVVNRRVFAATYEIVAPAPQ